MTEIIFGTITAAIFANEPFGLREIAGVFLISAGAGRKEGSPRRTLGAGRKEGGV